MARRPLLDLALLYLKLGITGFGGPAAHIAMMDDEVVRRRAWMTRQQFLDFVGATNLIPGPNSTELAMHVGHHRAGLPGLVVAGVAFIAPAALIVGAIAAWYQHYGTRPAVEGVLYGIKPVVIAIVVQALWGLGRVALKTPSLVALAGAALVAAVAGVHELAVLAGAGAAGALVGVGRLRSSGTAVVAGLAASATTVTAAGVTPVAPFSLATMTLVFLKAGALLFGSGYVLLAFLRADLVERLGWITESQLLDAIAIGQATPGPVLTTATFLGYVLAGPAGAALATAAIFLPAFVFVAVSGPLVPRLRHSRTAGATLDGVNAAAWVLMAVVTWRLALAALVDPLTIILAIASLLTLLKFRWNSAVLIAFGAAAGVVAHVR